MLSVKYGGNTNSGDWLLAYAYIEGLSANGDFTQSDWSRYTPAGVDMQGHDFKASYSFNQHLTLAARISTQERGNRFRLDLNFNF